MHLPNTHTHTHTHTHTQAFLPLPDCERMKAVDRVVVRVGRVLPLLHRAV